MYNEGKYNKEATIILVVILASTISLSDFTYFWNDIVNRDFVQTVVGWVAIYLAWTAWTTSQNHFKIDKEIEYQKVRFDFHRYLLETITNDEIVQRLVKEWHNEFQDIPAMQNKIEETIVDSIWRLQILLAKHSWTELPEENVN